MPKLEDNLKKVDVPEFKGKLVELNLKLKNLQNLRNENLKTSSSSSNTDQPIANSAIKDKSKSSLPNLSYKPTNYLNNLIVSIDELLEDLKRIDIEGRFNCPAQLLSFQIDDQDVFDTNKHEKLYEIFKQAENLFDQHKDKPKDKISLRGAPEIAREGSSILVNLADDALSEISQAKLESNKAQVNNLSNVEKSPTAVSTVPNASQVPEPSTNLNSTETTEVDEETKPLAAIPDDLPPLERQLLDPLTLVDFLKGLTPAKRRLLPLNNEKKEKELSESQTKILHKILDFCVETLPEDSKDFSNQKMLRHELQNSPEFLDYIIELQDKDFDRVYVQRDVGSNQVQPKIASLVQLVLDRSIPRNNDQASMQRAENNYTQPATAPGNTDSDSPAPVNFVSDNAGPINVVSSENNVFSNMYEPLGPSNRIKAPGLAKKVNPKPTTLGAQFEARQKKEESQSPLNIKLKKLADQYTGFAADLANKGNSEHVQVAEFFLDQAKRINDISSKPLDISQQEKLETFLKGQTEYERFVQTIKDTNFTENITNLVNNLTNNFNMLEEVDEQIDFVIQEDKKIKVLKNILVPENKLKNLLKRFIIDDSVPKGASLIGYLKDFANNIKEEQLKQNVQVHEGITNFINATNGKVLSFDVETLERMVLELNQANNDTQIGEIFGRMATVFHVTDSEDELESMEISNSESQTNEIQKLRDQVVALKTEFEILPTDESLNISILETIKEKIESLAKQLSVLVDEEKDTDPNSPKSKSMNSLNIEIRQISESVDQKISELVSNTSVNSEPKGELTNNTNEAALKVDEIYKKVKSLEAKVKKRVTFGTGSTQEFETDDSAIRSIIGKELLDLVEQADEIGRELSNAPKSVATSTVLKKIAEIKTIAQDVSQDSELVSQQVLNPNDVDLIDKEDSDAAPTEATAAEATAAEATAAEATAAEATAAEAAAAEAAAAATEAAATEAAAAEAAATEAAAEAKKQADAVAEVAAAEAAAEAKKQAEAVAEVAAPEATATEATATEAAATEATATEATATEATATEATATEAAATEAAAEAKKQADAVAEVAAAAVKAQNQATATATDSAAETQDTDDLDNSQLTVEGSQLGRDRPEGVPSGPRLAIPITNNAQKLFQDRIAVEHAILEGMQNKPNLQNAVLMDKAQWALHVDERIKTLKEYSKHSLDDVNLLSQFNGETRRRDNHVATYQGIKIDKTEKGYRIEVPANLETNEQGAHIAVDSGEVACSMANPTDRVLAIMIIEVAKKLEKVNDKNFEIKDCDNDPKTALKLYMLGLTQGLKPKLTDICLQAIQSQEELKNIYNKAEETMANAKQTPQQNKVQLMGFINSVTEGRQEIMDDFHQEIAKAAAKATTPENKGPS